MQLIASENFTSPAVLEATGSVLTNKYSEGYPGKRYYGGNEVIDEVEDLARDRAKALFGAEHANVQPHSGANANLGVYLALLEPGDTVLGMSLDHGGHLTHGSPVNVSGRLYRLRRLRRDRRATSASTTTRSATWPGRERPKMIVAGATAYPRIIDPESAARHRRRGRRAVHVRRRPHRRADRRRRAPRTRCRTPTSSPSPPTRPCAVRAAAASCAAAELATAIDKAIFPGLQGGPLEHVIAAKAVAFREAADPSFRDYAAQIVRNASALAAALAGEGFRLVSGGTDNHLMLVDLRAFDAELTGKEAQTVLDRAGITLNKNTDPRRPPLAVRHQRPAHRHPGGDHPGHGRGARWRRSPPSSPGPCAGRDDDAELAAVRDDVATLCSKFPSMRDPLRSRERSSSARRFGSRRGAGGSSPAQRMPGGAYLVVLAVAAATTAVLVPLVRRFAIRIGAVVKPDERRVHERPTPTLGGIGMLVGFLVGMVVAWRLDAFATVFDDNTEPLGLVIAAVVILGVGVIDDLREVSAPAKTSGIVLAASVLVFSGVSILSFRVPFVGTFVARSQLVVPAERDLGARHVPTPSTSSTGSTGWRPASSPSRPAPSSSTPTSSSTRALLPAGNIGPLIVVLVLGMCLGFLPYNVHPARIFMGDGGALLLGLLMAASTMVVGGRTDTPVSGQTFFFFAPVFIPLVILGVPILDTAFAIVRRARTRTSPATADKDHLHHRLMRLGHGQRRSVFILWGWTALLSRVRAVPDLHPQGRRRGADRHRRARPGALHVAASGTAGGEASRSRGGGRRRGHRPGGHRPGGGRREGGRPGRPAFRRAGRGAGSGRRSRLTGSRATAVPLGHAS